MNMDVDMVVANGENSAHGIGITVKTAQELIDAGVDVITSGNHIWAQRDIVNCMDGDLPIITAAQLSARCGGPRIH